ncbi:SDR family NAD(P)-dependent oxidoreductase [Brachybacterium kimchii]|uniref:SDR family NAD(P)-dependent oxidoreductase n=1 Tax=Brachybacterium kimchii TaxID=2942909 RepID=A0ABY4N150_9MICO|nr:SDR family NAD(P)-dependent oxidoreductase [Brachybacterium kimchii]UQN28275.1 SDR family NAD(P)-dependent oxidoreductase [Brachybacterium kimchii]
MNALDPTQTRRHDRSVLVTGASSGIGAATAIALSAEGWTVFAGVRDLSAAPETSGAGRIIPIRMDVTAPDTIAAGIAGMRDRLGGAPLDAVINNAGIGQLAPMSTVPPGQMRAIFDVNVFGAVQVTQDCLPLMRSGSRVLFVGSVGDRVTMPFGGALTASKWAIASIAEAFRLELVADGIRVILIEPGSIFSPAVDKVDASARATSAALAEAAPDLARRFARAASRAVENERSGSSPDVVARTIVRALTARRPATRYLTGKHARTLAALGRLPDPVFDRIRLTIFDQPASPQETP